MHKLLLIFEIVNRSEFSGHRTVTFAPSLLNILVSWVATIPSPPTILGSNSFDITHTFILLSSPIIPLLSDEF
ncbi:hypothetical protein D3C77_438150 [compost metagenome]